MPLRHKFPLLTAILVGLLFLSISAAEASLSESFMHEYGPAPADYVPNPGAFASVGTAQGTGYGVVTDQQSFSDKFEFTLSNALVTSVSLELRFDSTSNGGENWWTLEPNAASDNFKLQQTAVNNWFIQTFTFDKTNLLLLSPSFYNDGIFTLKFFEKTGGNNLDSFRLDYAKVTFNAQPVPVPGAALLLGSGLLGVVALRKRRTA